MNINTNYNSSYKLQNFTGVKLPSSDLKSAEDIVRQLRRVGFYCLGQKTKYCNNTVQDKIKMAKFIRGLSSFYDKEFGVLFFPWSKEGYILANPREELLIYRILKQTEEGVELNLSI